MASWVPIVDPRTGINAPHAVVSVQSLTEAAPSWPTDSGFSLVDVGGYNLTIEAAAGQTLLGTGGLTGFLYEDLVGGYAYAPDLNITIPSSAAGQRRVVLLNPPTSNPRSVIAHMANAVGVSGGAGITLYYTATTLRAHRG